MSETVVVTGASSGIGLELARLFAADGSRLVLVARREERLQELARELRERFGTEAVVLATDLTQEGAVDALGGRISDAGLQVDVLVNNAGFGLRGPFVEQDAGRQLEMIQLNVTVLTHLARACLPGMLARGRGGVLNVGSLAGFQPGPHMAVYYATKAYVLSLSEALAEEVRGSGVTVTCLAPGPTETEFVDVAGMKGVRLFRTGSMSAEEVARAGHGGFRAGRVIVLPGATVKLSAFLVRFGPRSVVRKIAGYLNC